MWAVSPKIECHSNNNFVSKLKLLKNVFFIKPGSKLIFFNEKKKKDSKINDIENWLWMSKFLDFWCHCAISAFQVSKKHFAMFDFFCKIESCVERGTPKRPNSTLVTQAIFYQFDQTSSLWMLLSRETRAVQCKSTDVVYLITTTWNFFTIVLYYMRRSKQ